MRDFRLSWRTHGTPRRVAAAHHPPRTGLGHTMSKCHVAVLRRCPSQEREFSNPVKWPTVPPTTSEAQGSGATVFSSGGQVRSGVWKCVKEGGGSHPRLHGSPFESFLKLCYSGVIRDPKVISCSVQPHSLEPEQSFLAPTGRRVPEVHALQMLGSRV